MWLKGSTDFDHCGQDIFDLLSGAIASNQRSVAGQVANGAQVSGDDAWVVIDAANKILRSTATYIPWNQPLTL